MQLSKIWRTYRYAIVSGVIILACVVALFIGIIPLTQKSLGFAQTSVSLSSEITLLQTKSAALGGLDEQTLRNDLATLTSAVPPDKSLSTVLDTIGNLTAQTGVTITDFTLSRLGSIATESAKKQTAEERKLGSSMLSFSLSVIGSYDQVKNFVTQAGSVRRLFRIQTVDIFFPKLGMATVHMTLAAFYSPLPTTIGAVSTPLSSVSDSEQQTIDKVSAMPLVSSYAGSGLVSAPVSGGKADPFSP